MSRPRQLLVALVLLAATAACQHDPSKPGGGRPPADEAVAAVAQALTTFDFDDAPMWGASADEAEVIVAAMDGFRPEVTAGDVTYSEKDDDTATATLHVVWELASGEWAYDTTVDLLYTGKVWRAYWSPALYHPSLDSTNRLIRLRLPAQRGSIISQNGEALIEEITIVRVGIDKTFIPEEEWETSARALAERLEIDPDEYAQTVAEAGELAFVTAATLRQHQVPDILGIPGARGIEDKAMLGPTPGFMAEVLGTVHLATAEDIEGSDGAIEAGDQVGAGGLQHTFDDLLSGTPGEQVYLGPRDEVSEPAAGVTVWNHPAEAGQDLVVSFEFDWQEKAEAAVATAGQPAAAVVIRPSDGAILAAAISPELEGRPDATLNHYAPGSTFKVVTSLALLRHGYTADSPVNCSYSAQAGGMVMTNYPGYPSAYNGSISLATALAQSCNTAFVNQVGVLGEEDLLNAAASLGAGVDYDAGGLLYGIVPIPDSEAMMGQMVIGQGGVLMSPVAMAGVVASVAASQTVVPWMVASLQPTPEATPLTADEAAQLQRMMAYAVTDGLASNLAGVAVGAKSGTAEYGDPADNRSHAWMIAYTDHDIAAAVWVQDGGGSGTAGPVIYQILA